MAMNLREQALAALRFEEATPTPYTVWYDAATKNKVALAVADDEWEKRLQNCIRRISVEWEPKNYIRPGYFRDLHGAEWQEGEPLHLAKPALAKPELSGYNIPSYEKYARFAPALPSSGKHGIIPLLSFEQAKAMLAEAGNSVFTVAGFGTGIFERAWMIRGFEDFFCDLVQEQDFAHKLLDLILQRQLELLDVMLELPCDGIIFNDDWGDQRGVITGPELWRKFIKPRVRQLYAKVHAAGKMTFHHSCGNVFDIIPDLVEIGLDCLQSLQPEALPVYEVKKRYGQSLRLWGGLGTQRLLPFGTPDEIRAEIRDLRANLGKNGGYIFSSSKPIFHDVPIRNALAFLEETTGVTF